jgi:hypothetical protein
MLLTSIYCRFGPCIPSCCEPHSFDGLCDSVLLFVFSGAISASDNISPSAINVNDAMEDALGKCGWEKVK